MRDAQGQGDGAGAAADAAPVRYKLTVAYDGTGFCGWQKQEPSEVAGGGEGEGGQRDGGDGVTRAYSEGTPRMESVRAGRVALRTVQGVLEQVVRGVCREPGIELMGASRTDSGVHARGQVAAFTTWPGSRGIGWPAERGAERLAMAINSRLPEDIVVRVAEITHGRFDPIGDCEAKGYSYTYYVSPRRPLWDRAFVHHVRHPEGLDIAAMQAAGAMLVGEHDFAAFAAAGHGRLTTVRRINALSVRDISGEDEPAGTRIRMDVSGSGFLWNMVRIIAGTLLHAGIGRMTAADVGAALASRERRHAGPTLGPEGLCLEWIRYGLEAGGQSPK
ncbi:MAG: tRNA pseudouridine synthase A [Phycisphaerales bacterium]|nr:tRNA pseudouridine synthase A [Phycisphaerales bacterium]